MKYKILKDFPGSPDGSTVVHYKKDDEVELTKSLADCVVPEGWAKPVIEKTFPQTKVVSRPQAEPKRRGRKPKAAK